MEGGVLGHRAVGRLDEGLDGALARDGGGEVEVAVVPGLEEEDPDPGVIVEVAPQGIDLDDGNAAVEVSPDVVRLRGRAVIDVAPDVEIEVLPPQFFVGDGSAVLLYLQAVPVDVGGLLDVLGPEASSGSCPP